MAAFCVTFAPTDREGCRVFGLALRRFGTVGVRGRHRDLAIDCDFDTVRQRTAKRVYIPVDWVPVVIEFGCDAVFLKYLLLDANSIRIDIDRDRIVSRLNAFNVKCDCIAGSNTQVRVLDAATQAAPPRRRTTRCNIVAGVIFVVDRTPITRGSLVFCPEPKPSRGGRTPAFFVERCLRRIGRAVREHNDPIRVRNRHVRDVKLDRNKPNSAAGRLIIGSPIVRRILVY